MNDALILALAGGGGGGGGGGNPRDNAKNVTYSELVALKTAGELVPGMWYRITDYVTKINGTISTNSAYLHYAKSDEHPFDILVLATGTDELSENSLAALHEGDTYFAYSDLSAWELKYTVDNSSAKFLWADNDNGKGVIYYMKDEWGNEASYDFKNIMYLRYKLASEDASFQELSTDPYFGGTPYAIVQKFMGRGVYCGKYDFAVGANILAALQSSTVDATYLSTFMADWYYTFDHLFLLGGSYAHTDMSLNPGTSACRCYGNKIAGGIDVIAKQFGVVAMGLPNICFEHIIQKEITSSCIGNVFLENCAYCTFKYNTEGNMLDLGFVDITASSYFSNNKLGAGCQTNIFENHCSDNILDANCIANAFRYQSVCNKLGEECEGNTLSGKGNVLGEDNTYNTISGNNNSFGCDAYQNSWQGSNCTFGIYCRNNVCSYNCQDITFGNNCNNNQFSNSCQRIKLDDDCSNNQFGADCNHIKLGYYSRSNKIGERAFNITLGNAAYNNEIGSSCWEITFGSNCSYIVIGKQNNDVLDGYIRYCNFGDYVYYVDLTASTLDSNHYGQNYNIMSTVQGTSNSRQVITIGTTYSDNDRISPTTYVGYNSSNVLKTWCPADLAP